MSSVIDYLYDGVVDTYEETIDYWSKDESVSDAIDVIEWSVENPKIVKDATIDGIKESSHGLKNAINQDFNKLIITVLAAAAIYIYVKGGKSAK